MANQGGSQNSHPDCFCTGKTLPTLVFIAVLCVLFRLWLTVAFIPYFQRLFYVKDF